MSKTGGNFFEEHIEKMVLIVVGLVCLWLLFSRVIFSPNYVEYDGKQFDSSEIDDYVSILAEDLRDKVNRQTEPKDLYQPKLDDFLTRVDSGISGVNVSSHFPLPGIITIDIGARSKFRIPVIGEVNDIAVECMRVVAYVPTEEIDRDNAYGSENSEPNDIDLVTVQASFDVAGLYKNFYESFTGEEVPEEWRDPCLAEPIFGAVQLQRQELLSDGSWSQWQDAPRARIDPYRKMLEITEDINELPPGGMKVHLLRFNDLEVCQFILQPEVYSIASANEEWFPPSLYQQHIKSKAEEEKREKIQARVAEKEQREQERRAARIERSKKAKANRKSAARSTGGEFDDAMDDIIDSVYPPKDKRSSRERSRRRGDRGRGRTAKPGRPTRQSRSGRSSTTRKRDRDFRDSAIGEDSTTRFDAYEEFDKILINEKTDFSAMSEPLIFWAYDDTVEPNKSYRYRIRLGILNPVAGTNKFEKKYESLKNKVILWSDFSDITAVLKIPGTLYFFPRDIQKAARTVTVQVSRYVLGYWYSKDFIVKQGEVIGKVVADEIEQDQKDTTGPESIDYGTRAVLVDISGPVTNWSGPKSLRTKYYFDMFYSFDGSSIERMPIKRANWTKELQLKFREISNSQKEEKTQLRPFEGGKRQQRIRRGRIPLEFEGEEGDIDWEDILQRL